MRYRRAKSLFILIFCFAFQAFGQPVEETEVRILKEVHSKNWECSLRKNEVISKEEDFRKLRAAEDCSILTKTLRVDFAKETLISYNIQGDCAVSGDAKVFRSDAEKKYTVRIRTKWGGCRAAGSFRSLIVIEKIPADYKVEFEEKPMTYTKWNEKDVFRLPTPSEPLEIKTIDLKGCIQTIYTKRFIIRDEAAYLKTVRNDASRDYCLKNVEKIDFSKHTLLGIDINSGYCRYPEGLKYEVIRDDRAKQYLFNITYLDPRGSVCRAMSEYDLWILAPKIPDGYEAKFDVKAVDK